MQLCSTLLAARFGLRFHKTEFIYFRRANVFEDEDRCKRLIVDGTGHKRLVTSAMPFEFASEMRFKKVSVRSRVFKICRLPPHNKL